MTDLANSVILPREDFIELSTVAFDNHRIPSIGERTAQAAQTTIVLSALAGAATVAAWGVMAANDWFERRQYERKLAEKKFNLENNY